MQYLWLQMQDRRERDFEREREKEHFQAGWREYSPQTGIATVLRRREIPVGQSLAQLDRNFYICLFADRN